MKSIRCGGDPDITVHKAALSHGMYHLPDLRQLLAEPGVDLVVLGEPQWENELSLYNFDLHAAGINAIWFNYAVHSIVTMSVLWSRR
jgi:hypothetical protein